MATISYSYKNDGEKFLSEHFQVKEFASFGNGKLYSDVILIDNELINKLETLFSKLNASKCIISSGYRTKECDIAVGGSGVGQHVNGKASDCIFYDENGNIIPSKIVICVAFDLGIFRMCLIEDITATMQSDTFATFNTDDTDMSGVDGTIEFRDNTVILRITYSLQEVVKNNLTFTCDHIMEVEDY